MIIGRNRTARFGLRELRFIEAFFSPTMSVMTFDLAS